MDVHYGGGEHLLCVTMRPGLSGHPLSILPCPGAEPDDIRGRCTQLSLSAGFLRGCHPSPSFPAFSHSCSLFLTALPHGSLKAAGSIELDEIRHIDFILRHS